MNGLQQSFGKNLRRLRVLRGMTQEQLAISSSLSLQHIGSIERGAGNPTLLSMGRIALALNVSLEDLFDLGLFKRDPEALRKELVHELTCADHAAVIKLYALSKLLHSDF